MEPFLVSRPLAVATLVARGRSVVVESGDLAVAAPLDDGILAAIEAILGELRSPTIGDLPPLHGGLVGYLGYDVVREVERLGSPPHDDLGLPDAVVSVIGELAAFDHWRQRVTLVDNVIVPLAGDGTADVAGCRREVRPRHSRLERLRDDLEQPVGEPLVPPPARIERLERRDVRRVVSSANYQLAVEAAKEYIRAGDAFQIVLSQRFDLDIGCEPFDVYRVLRQVNPSPYMFFLRQGGVTVVGASPEPLVQLLDRRVISRPIAGTRRRGETEEEDRGWKPSWPSTRRSWPSTSCSSTWPETTSGGWCASGPSTSAS